MVHLLFECALFRNKLHLLFFLKYVYMYKCGLTTSRNINKSWVWHPCADLEGKGRGLSGGFRPPPLKNSNFFKLDSKFTKNMPWTTQITFEPPPPPLLEKCSGSLHDWDLHIYRIFFLKCILKSIIKNKKKDQVLNTSMRTGQTLAWVRHLRSLEDLLSKHLVCTLSVYNTYKYDWVLTIKCMTDRKHNGRKSEQA